MPINSKADLRGNRRRPQTIGDIGGSQERSDLLDFGDLPTKFRVTNAVARSIASASE